MILHASLALADHRVALQIRHGRHRRSLERGAAQGPRAAAQRPIINQIVSRTADDNQGRNRPMSCLDHV